MNALVKLYLLVKTLIMNGKNEEKYCGVSTDFIKKSTDFSFRIIGEKSFLNIPLSKMYRLKNVQN